MQYIANWGENKIIVIVNNLTNIMLIPEPSEGTFQSSFGLRSSYSYPNHYQPPLTSLACPLPNYSNPHKNKNLTKKRQQFLRLTFNL